MTTTRLETDGITQGSSSGGDVDGQILNIF